MIYELPLSTNCFLFVLPIIPALLFCGRLIVCSRHISAPTSLNWPGVHFTINFPARKLWYTSGAVSSNFIMSSGYREAQLRKCDQMLQTSVIWTSGCSNEGSNHLLCMLRSNPRIGTPFGQICPSMKMFRTSGFDYIWNLWTHSVRCWAVWKSCMISLLLSLFGDATASLRDLMNCNSCRYWAPFFWKNSHHCSLSIDSPRRSTPLSDLT